MPEHIIEPIATLYPVPVVWITTGGQRPNVMICHRIASCSVEPLRLAISLQPGRYLDALIHESGEFVVNLPPPEQSTLVDYIGVVTGQKEDKIAVAGLKLALC